MKIGICPKCGEIINLDSIEVLDPKSIIGCGQAEDCFTSCHECGNKYGSECCKKLQKHDTWTPTRAEDYVPKGL